jgi:hypothetical protein
MKTSPAPLAESCAGAWATAVRPGKLRAIATQRARGGEFAASDTPFGRGQCPMSWVAYSSAHAESRRSEGRVLAQVVSDRVRGEHTFVNAQGRAYSQFKRALAGRNVMLGWTLASELPQVPLADALALLLLARDLEPARYDRAVPRWHARLCTERRLSAGEAQLALAALSALPGTGAVGAAQALAAVCELHGLNKEVRVIEAWLDDRGRSPR